MDFSIKKCIAWSGDLTSSEDWQAYAQGKKELTTEQTIPLLKQIPAMQRRRLSPFAKISLHCALAAADGYLDSVPCVFASRHGDLQKTSQLISDVAAKEVLSPTNFGLSVHNAVGGLFSIYTANKEPLTAISAGEDTFFIAILDAVSKLYSNNYKRILVVYTENIVPEMYQQFISQEEISISTALLIENVDTNNSFSLTMNQNKDNEAAENQRLQVLDFLNFYYKDKNQVEVKSKRHLWTLSKN